MSDLSTFTSSFFPFFAAFFAAFFAIFLILPGFVICAFPFATSGVSRRTTTCTNLSTSARRRPFQGRPSSRRLLSAAYSMEVDMSVVSAAWSRPPSAEPREQRFVCYRDICTWPVWWRPIARAAAGDKSM